jgi:uncharacterized protein (TIGR02145 family)
MWKEYWINQVIFGVVILLLAAGCKKEETTSDKVYPITHWPAAKTLVATNVDSTIAKLTGIVNGYGLSTTVTFEYDTTTSYGNSVTAIQSPVTGDSITNVSADISGLIPNTIYHYRIKAENSTWINFYGSENIFYTGPNVIDVDSNIYHTIKIGSQVWMQENLKTTRYNNGDIIGTTTPATLGIASETSPKYQWPNSGDGNDSSNVAIYGRLYTWYAVTDIRNVCPTGWHVPSNDEWHVLSNYLGGDTVAGGKLKESGTSHWLYPDDGATNESGFTALPGGCRWPPRDESHGDRFAQPGSFAFWWTSTEFGVIEAYGWHLQESYDWYESWYHKAYGNSVRCIKDN